MGLADEIREGLERVAEESPGVLARRVGEIPSPEELLQTALRATAKLGEYLVAVGIVVDALTDVITEDPAVEQRLREALERRRRAAGNG